MEVAIISFNQGNETLRTIAASVLISAAVGGIVGFLCRGRIHRRIIASSAVVAILFVLMRFWNGTLSFRESFADNFNASTYLIVPFILMFLLPAVIISVVVGRWAHRRK